MSVHITDERQSATGPWNADNDRVLERLALNEDSDIPWTDLRRIIRQKLAHAVELLIRRQEKADVIARQESEEEREDSNSSDLSDDTPAPGAEASSRKRGRFESTSTTDVRITAASGSAASMVNDRCKDEDNDEVMSEEAVTTDKTLVADLDGAMAVSEVSPEPPASSSALPIGCSRGLVGVVANSAVANGDSAAISPDTANGHRGPQAGDESEEPKEDVPREQAAGGPVDPVREMRDLEERIGYCLHTFDEAPFTIQRIAELLMWPERHYRSVIKFLRAVERVVYVTSTVDEFPLTVDRSVPEQQVDMPIESDGDTRAASASLFSFLVVAQDEQPTGDVSASVQTKAVTMRPPSTSYAKAAEAKSSPSLTMMPPLPGASGAPPLDASDTGILHIAPLSAESEDTLRAKMGSSIDTAGIPLCIDEVDGRSGKVAVRPANIMVSTIETSPKE
ncbi:hypothetical protein IWW37_005286 [Coemansia sp. RSA 2050]|nr:hypothetical protein IWW37_005286 [Coemansia sp. RSA 2050]